MTWASATPTGVRLQLHIQPRAARTEVAGLHGDALKIRLAAPPVDGAANEALVRWLVHTLDVPAHAVVLTGGLGSRRKSVLVSGATVASVQVLLGPDATARGETL